MGILGRSSSFAGLPLHCRIQNSHTRHVSRLIPCVSSPRRFKSFVIRNLGISSGNYDKHRMFMHRSCSSAESSFQDMMSFRHKQAKHSVLIELSSRVDIPSILNLCKAYGDVKNMIAFVNRKSKLQVFAEFMHEESVQKLLCDSSIKYAAEGYPCHSRCLLFENLGKQGNPVVAPGEVTELGIKNSVTKKPSSVSEMMMELYETEKMSEISIRLRFLCSVLLQDILKGIFPYCTAFPFGSSSNGFGKASSDLDLMLRLYPEQVIKNPEVYLRARYVKGNSHALQRYAIQAIGDILLTFAPGVNNVQKILRARMPIVKYEHQHLNLECDVSINNMASVYMTEILFYCGELDPRIRPLVYTVKNWARQTGITMKDPGPYITNFALTLLVLFFLQSRPVPIFPPLYKLIKMPDPEDYRVHAIQYLNKGNSNNRKLAFTGQKNTESLDVLLQEFFRFLAVFPFKEQRLSVIGGSSNPSREGYAISIDYPMDESQNVSKNVSFEELKNLRDAAVAALKNLENLRTNMKNTNLMSILGVSDSAQGIPDRIDVRTFLDVSSETEAIRHGR